MTKPPRHFFAPLASGAPAPLRELPVKLERTIHFVPAHNEKLRSRVGDMAKQADVILANLEDAIPADAKEAARAGAIEMGAGFDFAGAGVGYWSRINALNSPWHLDDVTELVANIGNQLDVIMVPKVEGPWDIHYMDQLLALLEAKHAVKRPILLHAILETAQGVANVEAIAGASPRMHGICLGPADLAASRKMKTTRVGGGHPGYRVLSDAVDGESGVKHVFRDRRELDRDACGLLARLGNKDGPGDQHGPCRIDDDPRFPLLDHAVADRLHQSPGLAACAGREIEGDVGHVDQHPVRVGKD